MSLPSRSKVFAVISLVIAVVLISINVVSCVSESHFFSNDKAMNGGQKESLQVCVSNEPAAVQDDLNQFNN